MKLKLPSAIELPPMGQREVYAIQNLYRGEATPEQQKLAMTWIITKLAETGGISFSGSDQSTTDFKEGKSFVGWVLTQIVTDPMFTHPILNPQPRSKNARSDRHRVNRSGASG